MLYYTVGNARDATQFPSHRLASEVAVIYNRYFEKDGPAKLCRFWSIPKLGLSVGIPQFWRWRSNG